MRNKLIGNLTKIYQKKFDKTNNKQIQCIFAIAINWKSTHLKLKINIQKPISFHSNEINYVQNVKLHNALQQHHQKPINFHFNSSFLPFEQNFSPRDNHILLPVSHIGCTLTFNIHLIASCEGANRIVDIISPCNALVEENQESQRRVAASKSNQESFIRPRFHSLHLPGASAHFCCIISLARSNSLANVSNLINIRGVCYYLSHQQRQQVYIHIRCERRLHD